MWNIRWCLEIHGGPRTASNTQCIVTVSVKSGCRPADKFLGAVRDPVGTVQARGLKTLGGHLRTCGQRRGADFEDVFSMAVLTTKPTWFLITPWCNVWSSSMKNISNESSLGVMFDSCSLP